MNPPSEITDEHARKIAESLNEAAAVLLFQGMTAVDAREANRVLGRWRAAAKSLQRLRGLTLRKRARLAKKVKDIKDVQVDTVARIAGTRFKGL